MRPRATAGSFDGLADSYDRYRIGYADDLYDVLAECGIRAAANVVDVACGTGLATNALVQRGCTMTGVDISEPMLARARVRVPNATFILGSATALPLDDATFDAATCAQAFHWFDQPRSLAELSRVVKPGGTVAIWWRGLMRGDATRLIREQTAEELGLEPLPYLLASPFTTFEESPLIEQRLRVIPWIVPMRVGEYLGYERSRARARDAYGADLSRYLDRLAERLGPEDAELSLSYVHLLYLGRVPEQS